MNLTMIKVMQGLVDGVNEEYLLHQLDMAKNVVHSDTIKMDEDMSDELISNEDSLIDAEEIDVNEREIKNIYVSLKKFFCVDLNQHCKIF